MARTTRDNCMVIGVSILAAAMLLTGGCSTAVRTYDGQAKPLQEVAIIRTTPDTCPITRIDGASIGADYRAGNEYHLLPGKHTIQVVDVPEECGEYCRIELANLEYDFQAGHVYSIPRADQAVSASPFGGPPSMVRVAEQGDVVAFASKNPDYFRYASAWKELRKANGLAPSIFDGIKLPKLTFDWFKSEPTTVAQKEPVQQF